jgi:hypothetical protein
MTDPMTDKRQWLWPHIRARASDLRPSCRRCAYFDAAASRIEAALPGLSVLSSGYAAVRSDDGLCRLHERYVAATSACSAAR